MGFWASHSKFQSLSLNLVSLRASFIYQQDRTEGETYYLSPAAAAVAIDVVWMPCGPKHEHATWLLDQPWEYLDSDATHMARTIAVAINDNTWPLKLWPTLTDIIGRGNFAWSATRIRSVNDSSILQWKRLTWSMVRSSHLNAVQDVVVLRSCGFIFGVTWLRLQPAPIASTSVRDG